MDGSRFLHTSGVSRTTAALKVYDKMHIPLAKVTSAEGLSSVQGSGAGQYRTVTVQLDGLVTQAFNLLRAWADTP